MFTTPVTLLARLREPDRPDAWAAFVDLYTPVLFAWARQLRLQDADAADLVQDVFARLVVKLPGFDYDRAGSFRGWLRAVAVNQWRAGRRRKAVSAGGVDPDELPAPEAEAFWERDYRREVVGRALALMRAEFHPATWRACWECVAHGRPAPDVAAELGLTPGAVRAAKFRVLTRLRTQLDGLIDGPADSA